MACKHDSPAASNDWGVDDPEFPRGDAPPDATRANWSGAHLGRTVAVGRFPANGYESARGLPEGSGRVSESRNFF
jgi:hypothetical protein